MSSIVKNQLCECCALWVANNDESACRDFYGHDHPYARSEVAGVDIDAGPDTRDDSWVCDGCDRRLLPGAEAWNYFRL